MTRTTPIKLLVAAAIGAMFACGPAIAQKPAAAEGKDPSSVKPVPPPPRKDAGVVYIPYKDLSAAMDPSAKNVLMDRQEFQKLLEESQKNRSAARIELGQIVAAEYQVKIQGEKFTMTGELSAVSGSDKPVAVYLGFGQLGITRLTLDDKPAPLGYDGQGKLVLIVSGRGSHKVTLEASSGLKELAGGGLQMSMLIPPAVAGTMTVASPGDLEAHASVPVRSVQFEKAEDRTVVQLTVGGAGSVTMVLLGNGRQDNERAILMGESVTSVRISPSGQNLSCLYSVQILRRGTRELQFLLPKNWTVTDVECPSMVKWLLEDAKGDQKLTVRLRAASRGDQALRLQAVAKNPEDAWTGPYLRMVDAAHERGYMVVDPGDELRIRGELLGDARREDPVACRQQTVVPIGLAGRIYYHWGDAWSVKLGLTAVELRRSVEEQQALRVSQHELELTGDFQITAVGREMYDTTFVLPPRKSGWDLNSVTLPNSAEFQYRQAEQDGKNVLKIDFARPILAEAVQPVHIVLKAVPEKWDQTADSAGRQISVPLIQTQADTISGIAVVYPRDDLDIAEGKAPQMFKAIPVGRMASLGLSSEAQTAWKYESQAQGDLQLKIERRRPRLNSVSIGLVSLLPTRLIGDWTVAYEITRASTRTLYLLSDKVLGQNLRLECAEAVISEKTVVAPGPQTLALDPATASRYNLWRLTLDGQAKGILRIQVHYEIPLPAGEFEAPLIRQAGAAQAAEMLAIQASEELAIQVRSAGVKDMDSVDLPALPARAGRILYAMQLESPGEGQSATRPAADAVSIKLSTRIHDNYKIPSSLAVSAKYVTYIDNDASQRTQVNFVLASSSMQFLPVALPAGSELWSLQIDGAPVKPKKDRQDVYLAPMPAGKPSVAVRVVYASPAQPGAGLDKLKLAAVTIPGVQMNTVDWKVYPPAGYRIVKQDSKLEISGLYSAAPAYAKIFTWCARHLSEDEGGILTGRRSGGMNYYSVPESVSHKISRQAKELIDAEGDEVRMAPESGTRHTAPGISGAQAVSRSENRLAKDGIVELKKLVEVAKPLPQAKEIEEHKQFVPSAITAGRYTLPVELEASYELGEPISLHGFQVDEPVVELASRSSVRTLWWLGFIFVAVAGVLRMRRTAASKVKFILLVMFCSSLLAIWLAGLVPFMNGLFYGALALAVFYPAWSALKWLAKKIVALPWNKKIALRSAGILILAAASLAGCDPSGGSSEGISAGGESNAAAPDPAKRAEPDETGKVWPVPTGVGPLVIPYQGSPTHAEQSSKVLIPYGKFVELWNLAHPDKPLEVKAPAGGVSVAGATYVAKVDEFPSQDAKDASMETGRMKIVLTMDVQTLGEGWVVLPMPMSGLAISSATLDGKAASLQAGPSGTILMLPPHTRGTVRIDALTTPAYQGLKGSVDLSLPPLPGAVMKVQLPSGDLDLEVPGVANLPAAVRTGNMTEWVVPLDALRNVSLRWSPKASVGPADKSLAAVVAHNVHAYHWAIVGVSRLQFNFSSGQNDRFTVLLPPGLTVTDMSGANLKDYQISGEKVLDGAKFQVAEVRLYRPAIKSYELTVRWMADLPALGKPAFVPLPQAGQVAGESGTVTLHAAGGMELKIADVTGGRRQGLSRSEISAGSSEAQTQVAQYYWPYRPFSLSIVLSRQAAKITCRADQLVRVESDRIQLLCNVKLQATQGRLFGGSFRLCEGYELLSCVGRLVGDWYVQTIGKEKRLHVSLRAAAQQADLALVLLQKEGLSGDTFAAPIITAIDADGNPLPEQTGMLAIQVSPSLEAQTLQMSGLKAVPPARAGAWLKEDRQIQAVQFAYEYEKPGGSLSLKINRMPSKARVELLAGVSVRQEQAVYTYRIRYNIEGSAIDHVSFTLPAEYAAEAAVNCPTLRSLTTTKDPDGRARFTVSFVNEITGQLDVMVNFAVPVSGLTSQIVVPQLRTDAPDGFRAIVAIQNSSRHELSSPEAAKLVPMSVTEQKAVLPEGLLSSLLAVWQGFSPDWSLSMKFTPAKQALRVQAVVDLMAITTILDSTGQSRYQVRILLQNRSEQFLRILIPEGLSLWSAFVAGQPVKPVQPADASAGAVLIPLVKTSPGGLPYEVTLYLGGQVIKELGGIARLAPPSIQVADIPVTRTTWSVRLPKEYRYFLQGGNVSPVAGKAELMNIELQAVTGQLERMERSFDDLSSQSMETAQQNWQTYNSELSTKRANLQQYISANRDKLNDQTIGSLNASIADNSNLQHNLQQGWEKQKKALQAASANDLNGLLNQSAQAGLSEQTRSGNLNEVPEFVRQAGQAQLEGLNADLEGWRRADKGGKDRPPDQPAQTPPADDSDVARGLLAGKSGEAKKEEVGKLMKKVQEEQAEQAQANEQNIRQQVANLQDNRMSRYYEGQKAKQAQGQQAQGPQGQQGIGYRIQPGRPQNAPNAAPPLIAANTDAPADLKSRLRFEFESAYKDQSKVKRSEPARSSRLVPGAAERPKEYDAEFNVGYNYLGLGLAGGEGVYSLAIDLPEGGTAFDYVCPGGKAELTIWAVPHKLESGFWSTLGVLIAGLIAFIAFRLRRKFLAGRKAPISLKKPLVCLGIIVLMIFLLGIMIGLIIGLCLAPIVWFIWHSIQAKRARA
ncbi:MAG: hypothetical protein HZA50_03110 [Planctomycetes bacterium]|nr:hypothetical protein [Planctomycetota bacterium]